MTFRIGQEVVCIDASAPDFWILGSNQPLTHGKIYVIERVYLRDDGIPLVALVNTNLECAPFNGWRANRFRPIIGNKKDISFTTGAPKDSNKWDNRRKVRERV